MIRRATLAAALLVAGTARPAHAWAPPPPSWRQACVLRQMGRAYPHECGHESPPPSPRGDYLDRIAWCESHQNPRAVSRSGRYQRRCLRPPSEAHMNDIHPRSFADIDAAIDSLPATCGAADQWAPGGRCGRPVRYAVMCDDPAGDGVQHVTTRCHTHVTDLDGSTFELDDRDDIAALAGLIAAYPTRCDKEKA